jgi:hypothetical protein
MSDVDKLLEALARTETRSITLASVCGYLVARLCANAADPEAEFMQIVEGLEDTVSGAMGQHLDFCPHRNHGNNDESHSHYCLGGTDGDSSVSRPNNLTKQE